VEGEGEVRPRLIYPSFWVWLKSRWWKLARLIRRRDRQIAWQGVMMYGIVNSAAGGSGGGERIVQRGGGDSSPDPYPALEMS